MVTRISGGRCSAAETWPSPPGVPDVGKRGTNGRESARNGFFLRVPGGGRRVVGAEVEVVVAGRVEIEGKWGSGVDGEDGVLVSRRSEQEAPAMNPWRWKLRSAAVVGRGFSIESL